MIKKGRLRVPVIGVAKAGWGLPQLRDRARASERASLEEHGGGVDELAFARLVELLRYVDGDYNDRSTFDHLRVVLDGAKRPLHYLAIPPTLFPVVVEHLGAAGVGREARIVVEKPFGRDLASAKQLNRCVHAVFDESDVSWRWEGVPFFIRAGKRLPLTKTEVLIQLRRPPLSGLVPGRSNYLRLQLTPELTIDLGALIKRPGEGMVAAATELSLVRTLEDEMTPYEQAARLTQSTGGWDGDR